MAKSRLREKPCETCGGAPDALYRAQAEEGGPWRFYCGPCLLKVKAGNDAYRYGGTWKRKKRH